MRNLRLEKPLAFFDLETTGVDPLEDRIVEICVLRFDPGGSRRGGTRRVHPGRPIPPEATAIHGIRDEDVRGAPPFREIAPRLLDFLGESDLGGFNIRRFDIPILERELRNCDLDLGLARRRVLDAMTIFHRKERRDLSAAVRLYLGREHVGAHGAQADVLATAEVLDAQLDRYRDLPRTVGGLDAWCSPVPAEVADRAGKFAWKSGEIVFCFGRYQGRTLREVAAEQRDYLEWILRTDFPPDARALVEAALRGSLPGAAQGGHS